MGVEIEIGIDVETSITIPIPISISKTAKFRLRKANGRTGHPGAGGTVNPVFSQTRPVRSAAADG
jgi:hypothetical protein